MKLLIFAFVFNFFSTWYFGWNMHPMSEWEHFSDHFCLVIMTLGFAQMMWRQEINKNKNEVKKEK